MKTADAFWQFLPEGLDELFEMVKFEKTDQSYDIWLDEKKKLSDEDFRNPNIVARGYTDYVTVQDSPMRVSDLPHRDLRYWDSYPRAKVIRLPTRYMYMFIGIILHCRERQYSTP